MTDCTELKRLAENHLSLGQAYTVAKPSVLLALIAENEQLAKTADCWDRLNVQNKALSDSFRAERDRLRAEVAGLRTGYEAYEQVNAELKAEVEGLRKDAEQWRALVRRAESPVIGYTGCVTCGVYTDHGGLSCPKMRATADAALGQGGESNECS